MTNGKEEQIPKIVDFAFNVQERLTPQKSRRQIAREATQSANEAFGYADRPRTKRQKMHDAADRMYNAAENLKYKLTWIFISPERARTLDEPTQKPEIGNP